VRYAIVSDIHGNLEALSEVLARLEPADGLFCLGDIVGYGPNPNECLALIRARAQGTVLGNHDVGAIDNHGLAYFNPAAREAIEWTQTVLAPEHVAWLDSLSYELRMPGFLLVHGAPVEYFRYVSDEQGAAEAFAATDAPLIFVGHTHVAEDYVREQSGLIRRESRRDGGRLVLETNARYLVNVGSVGQPRDRNPQASFCFYDPEARTVSWERVAYRIEETQEKIEAAALPDTLARRLALGR
jgi:diadenosine tetraphosphatase ApaH/serine/threonine PP2A family protein phosphatase